MKTYQLAGAGVHGIATLYEELDRLLMVEEDWRLGASLDGLNDVLYRVEGERARFVWADHAHSRDALGAQETERWLLGKLEHPEIFDQARIRRQLEDLRSGRGQTYWELVLEIFAEHPGIGLELR